VHAMIDVAVIFEGEKGSGSEQVKWCEETLQKYLEMEEKVTIQIAACESLKKKCCPKSEIR